MCQSLGPRTIELDSANTRRFDVMRGVAAIVVLLAHAAQAFAWRLYGAGSYLDMTSGWGARFAVLAFFLLSGRLITASIATNIKRNGAFDSMDYFLSRIARLYPPLLFAIALVLGVVAIIQIFGLPGFDGTALGTLRPSGMSFTAGELFKCLLLYDGMTGVDGPLWTLYIEAKLYVAAAGFSMLLSCHRTAIRLAGLVLVLLVLWTGPNHYRFWFFAIVWCLGALTNIRAASNPYAFVSIWSAVALACVLMSVPVDYIDRPAGTLVQILGCAAIAYTLLVHDWAEIDFPSWLGRTGDFSYTLYVSHFPILALLLSLSLAIAPSSAVVAGIAALLSIALALLIAIIAARSLEQPRKFKQALNQWLTVKISWVA